MIRHIRYATLVVCLILLASCSTSTLSNTHPTPTTVQAVGTRVAADPCASTGTAVQAIVPPSSGASMRSGLGTAISASAQLQGSGRAAADARAQAQPGIVQSPLQGFASWAGISMVSATDGWAVGGELSGEGPGQQQIGGLILHYVGGHWTPVSSPTSKLLTAIAMASPTEGWAVGWGGIVLRYAADRWTVAVQLGRYPIAFLDAITLVSPTEWWAVGNAMTRVGVTFGAYLHYNAGRLTYIDGDSIGIGAYPTSISMSGSNDGWAVGSESFAPALVHYESGQWTLDLTDTANLSFQDSLNSVIMLSPSNGWAVGVGGDIAHYCDGKWAFTKTGLYLRKVTMLTATDGWAVGATCCSGTEHAVIVHFQQGVWRIVPSPMDSMIGSFLIDISMTSSDDGWALGNSASNSASSNGPILLHYHGGAWSLYKG